MSTPQSTPDPQDGRGPRVLAIDPHGSATLVDLPAALVPMTRAVALLVGGELDAIMADGWCAYVRKDAERHGHWLNLQADAVARMLEYHFRLGDYLCGTVVFMGRDGGLETDVPERILDLAKRAGVHDIIHQEAV